MSGNTECPRCKRQVHSEGMIGGGWKVTGVGGPGELTLNIQRPEILGGANVTVVVSSHGEIREVRRVER